MSDQNQNDKNNNDETTNTRPNFALEASATLISFIFIPALIMLVLWFPLQSIAGTEAAIGVGLILQAVCLFTFREPVSGFLNRKFGSTRK